ncbi:Gfo/Idh/MocA family protein [Agromyces kandeliae]|uniref:Gfo/Idh/MocA family protein n=1 Tax=Agromyces kandeliae TaxID=2666141 RepID=UPI0018A204B9|nr:Gfo/Idh/MocA family oxidoreductase [Agromyces kandeliae]
MLSAPTSIRIGLIGAGAAGRLHADAIAAVPGLSLTAVAESRSGRSDDLARAHGATVRTVDELFGANDVDAVFIASPTASHLPLAHRAIAAGLHVFVEKPVAESPDEIRALARAAAGAGVVIVPGHNYLHQPECSRLVRQARDGTLGRVRSLHISYAIRHEEELASHYDGVLHEVMVHHAYLTLAALGRPDRVHGGVSAAHWARLETDDQAWMVWEYDDGALAMLYGTFAVDDLGPEPGTFAVKALGTEGTASYSWRSTTTVDRGGPFTFGIPLYEETYTHQARAFRDVLRGEAEPASTLEDAAVAAEIVASVGADADSYATGERRRTTREDPA